MSRRGASFKRMILSISSAFNYQRLVRRAIYFYWTTLLGRGQAILSGANTGRGIRFYGIPFIQIATSGSLSIGNNCAFRSSSTSNLIGINRPCILSVNPEAKLVIGNNCGFSGTVIGCFSNIKIGDGVRCGANTLITDSDWHPGDPRSSNAKGIFIDANVWLGVNVIVMKGVHIGENSVIGAGSVVTKDIPANVIAAGNPCKIIRSID